MSEHSSAIRSGADEGAAAGGATATVDGRVLHPRSFKLRFGASREPGRSYVSAVRPLGLPATVAGKFYTRPQPADEEAAAQLSELLALHRIRDMFELAPRDRLPEPLTSSHRYGWWWREGAACERERRSDPRRWYPLRDSPWLKGRLLVLAADRNN